MNSCETLKIEHVVGERSKQAVVQGDFQLPEPKPGIEKIISIDKIVKVKKVEVIKNKVIIEGHLNLQIVYAADCPDQPVHHTQARLEFTQFVDIPGAEPGMNAWAKVKVEDVQGKVKGHHGRLFDVTAIIFIQVKVTELAEISLMVTPPGSARY